MDANKGLPVRVFDHETIAKLSDRAVDVRGYNSLNVAVIVTGATPSATISAEGSDEAGGYYLQLPDANASRAGVTSSVNYDISAGTAFVRLRLASVSGTFGAGQGFTVIATPFNSAGPITVSVTAAAVTVANGGDVAQGATTDTPYDGAEDNTARTTISLLKGLKNYVKSAKDILTDVWTDALNALGVVLVPSTTGGLSKYRNIDLDETGVSIKASPGQVYGWQIYNRSVAERVVKLYDKATAPTVGTDTPVLTVPVSAGREAVGSFPHGIPFTAGIGAGATTGIADADTAAPSANDVVVNLFYK